jgi:hypothetical protein
VNILLVLTIPVALIAMSSAFGSQVNNAYADGQNDSLLSNNGLEYNGRQITNIFAYDASGRPLTDVQLFDQGGRPLDTVSDTALTVAEGPFLVPSGDVIGRKGWNVYPLEHIGASQLNGDAEPRKGAKPKPATPPFLIVAPLANSVPPTPTPTSTATPTPAPTN